MRKAIRVDNVPDLVAALRANKIVFLAPGTYNLGEPIVLNAKGS